MIILIICSTKSILVHPLESVFIRGLPINFQFPFLPTLPLIVYLKSHIFILPTFNSVVTYGLSCRCLGNLIKAMLMSLVSCQTIFLVFMTVILSQEPVILLLPYLPVTIKIINTDYALTLHTSSGMLVNV